jgi:aryl-alcohol dehydrogenase-like predicted oxidoreductase
MNKCVIGTWPLSGDLGLVSLSDVESILNYCYKLGFREFDTSPSYGNGFSEFALGKIFANKDDVFINTKVGNIPFNGKNFDIPVLRKSFKQSLKRLGRDSINALFLHNPRNENPDYGALIGLLNELKVEGKIKYAGISLARRFDYSTFCSISDFDVYQQEANLLSMKSIVEPHPKNCRFYAHSPLATGLLGGHIKASTVFPPGDKRSEWLKGERLKSILKRIEKIKAITNMNLANFSRRFLFSHPNVDSVVFGVKKLAHVDDIFVDSQKDLLDIPLLNDLERLYKNDFGLVGEEHLTY